MGSAMDGVKDAARSMTDIDPDSETGKLAREREEARRKIEASTARKAAERKAREAQQALEKAESLERASETPPQADQGEAISQTSCENSSTKKEDDA